ncbi:MAG: DUF4474 domain-containing protein [Clostridia bacterium]|nr:DUF4474 domain-containing protein [Clostridia bacterium]
MKNLLKKSAFILFTAVLMCLCVMGVSAADDGIATFAEGYELTISADYMFVGVNKTAQFEATVSGVEVQPAITWKSSDESIATVSASGAVKGKKEGYATITASAVVAGENLTASYPIQVVKNENIIHSYLETNNVLSYQYDYDYGYYYANDKESWQKNFGFARVYDYVAPYVGMEYDYIRVFFTYDEEDFMVQLWKGQYGVLYGGEIGIYNRDEDGQKSSPFTFYAAASEKYWPVMDMSVYHQEEEGDTPDEYELLFKRPVDKYWWCTGFVMGTLRQYEPADELRIEATITFRDAEMATLFANGIRDCGFTKAAEKQYMGIDSYYYGGGNDVSVSWQGISEAENTMGIKAGIGATFLLSLVNFLLKIGLVRLALFIIF